MKSVKDERQRVKLILELKAIEQGRAKYPNGEEMDADYRRMKYARYADDFSWELSEVSKMRNR